MTTPIWEAGHLYLTGDLVQPVQVEAPSQSALTNPGFETGVITGWSVVQTGGSGTVSVASDKKFAGTYAGRWQGASGTGHSGGVEAVWENATDADVVPGQSITAHIMALLEDASGSQNQAQVRLHWYDGGATLLRTDSGGLIHGDGRSWQQSSVTGIAPANAATVRLAAWTTANASGGVRLDDAQWNHVAPPTTAGLIYKAVQTGPGTSASSEPTWPTTLGVQVVDNTVTWEAVNTNRVVWEASPILVSGTTEPDWPTNPGDFVSDGSIKWECVSRRIEDVNCPNTKVVAILSSKVFAADGDIVRFSATANPLDWTSERDAGFLPTGLQQANANDMAVLAPYRGNLAAFNASSFQLWQTDPDPEAMAQLDQMEGIGSTWAKAAQPVGNDLLFLTKLGVRSVAIAAGADNLSAGDVGMPVDPLVQAAMRNATKALATYYPGAGQYWLHFPGGTSTVHVTLTADNFNAIVDGEWEFYINGVAVAHYDGSLGVQTWEVDVLSAATLNFTAYCTTANGDSGGNLFKVTVDVDGGPSPTYTISDFNGDARFPPSETANYQPGDVGYAAILDNPNAANLAAPATFVFTRNSAKGRWSRYDFTYFSIDAFAQLADDLYIRSGDTIKRVSEQAASDSHYKTELDYAGLVQWPWLEFGQPGTTKMLEGFDIVATGSPSVSIGYDQRDPAAFTTPYAIDPDTIPGDLIPLPVSGPTLSLKVTFPDDGAAWSLQQALLYVHDQQAGS